MNNECRKKIFKKERNGKVGRSIMFLSIAWKVVYVDPKLKELSNKVTRIHTLARGVSYNEKYFFHLI